MRSLKNEQQQFEYKTFEQLLFDIRFELARSRVMDTNIDKMQDHLQQEFALFD